MNESTVAFKGNVTRNKEAVMSSLNGALRRIGPVHDFNQVVLHTIRHHFTNYDQAWRAIENNSAKHTDICSYLKDWNKVVQNTADLVEKFVGYFFDAEEQGPLLMVNRQWLQSKLRPLPNDCEDEDEDPRLYRRGWKR